MSIKCTYENKNIPNGWELRKLKDVCIILNGGTPSRDVFDYWENGTIPWATPTDITNNKLRTISKTAECITWSGLKNSSAKVIPANSILMTSRATLGEAKINEVEMCTNQGFKNLVPFENINVWYLLYQILHLKNHFKRLGVGSTFPEVSKNDTEKFSIIYAPLQEQHEIAHILSTLDNVIEKTGALIEKEKQVKKGLMHDLFTRGILPDGRLRSPVSTAPDLYKKTKIGYIPKEWEIMNLGDVTDKKISYSLTGGPFGSDLKTEHYTESGVRIILLQNIGDGEFLNNEYLYTSIDKADQLISCNIYPGDIIISKMAEPLARACIIPELDNRYLMCSDGIRLVVDINNFNKHFILYSINSDYFRKNAEYLGTGTTRTRIGLVELKKLPIKIPKSKIEQEKIAITIDKLVLKIKKEESYLIKLKKIKDGLMEDLLTGKVRVKPK